jgi:O-antigen/teichoic acid export membrane protein
MLVSFFTGALINRSLEPAGRGILAEIQTWIQLAMVLFGLSIDSAIYHFSNMRRYPIENETRLQTILLLNSILALLAICFLSVGVSVWHRYFSDEMKLFLFPVSLLLTLTLIANNLTVFIQSMDWIRSAAVIGLLQSAANAAIISGGYFFSTIDLKFVLFTLVALQALACLLILGISAQKGLLKKLSFSISLAGKMIWAGLKQHIATVSTFAYTKVNQLILFRYCGEHETGIYAVSMNLAFAMFIIPMTFQTVLYPRVIQAEDDYAVTIRSLRLGLYLWGFVSLILIAAAKPILMLYGGADFSDSVDVFQILMIAVWLLPLSSFISPYYIKCGAFLMASATAVILGILSVALNFFLVPKYAALGAAWATTLTCLFGFVIALLFLGYLSKKNPMVIFLPGFVSEIEKFRLWRRNIG